MDTIPENLADDLLEGAEAISAYTGEPVRRVYYLAESKRAPIFKRGRRLYGRKSQLDKYYSAEATT